MESIFETLQERGDCNRFLRMINEAEMAEILDGPGPYTVFAPTDSAFNSLPDSFHKLEPDQTKLTDIVANHIVTGNYKSDDLDQVDEIVTMANQNLSAEKHNEGLIIGSARIVEADIECTNGILHIVDVVLT